MTALERLGALTPDPAINELVLILMDHFEREQSKHDNQDTDVTASPPNMTTGEEETREKMIADAKAWDRATLEQQYVNAHDAVVALTKCLGEQRKPKPADTVGEKIERLLLDGWKLSRNSGVFIFNGGTEERYIKNKTLSEALDAALAKVDGGGA